MTKFYEMINAETEDAIQMFAGSPRLSSKQKEALIAFSIAAERVKKEFQGEGEEITVTSHTRVTYEKAKMGEQVCANLYYATGYARNIAKSMVATFEEQANRAHQLLPDYPIDLMLLLITESEDIAVLSSILKRLENMDFTSANTLVDNFPETVSNKAFSIVQKVRLQQGGCPDPTCPACTLFKRLADKLEKMHSQSTPVAGVH